MCLCSWSLGANSTICSILRLADDQPDPKAPGAVIRVIVGTVSSSRGSCAAVLPRGESARLRSAAPSGSSPQLFIRAITLLLSCSCVLVTRRDIQTVNISRWSFFFISSAWTSLQSAPSFSRQATWTIWGRRLHAHPGRHPASAGRAALSVVSQSNEADLALFLSTHVHDYIFTDYTHPFFTWMIFFFVFFWLTAQHRCSRKPVHKPRDSMSVWPEPKPTFSRNIWLWYSRRLGVGAHDRPGLSVD